jgi:phosphopentomutase
MKMNKSFDRVILIILDGLGVGELPDADQYGDVGSDTLGNIAKAVGGLHLPNLERLGLGRVGDFKGLRSAGHRMGAYGRMAERSKGKDTTTGHWEMMGIILEKPFPVYPKGFPSEIIEPFKKAIGRDILGNIPASGTEIIKELGKKHLSTGYPILYTSADSVFQIAAHEEIIPIDELYHMCRIARKILVPPHNVSRVIARPFIGRAGQFTRTERRRDFSVEPLQETLLDKLCQHGIPVVGIGKIEDIFAARGITQAIHTRNDMDGVDQTLKVMSEVGRGLIFTNLVDFDTLYGHRNDVQGYAQNLREFDLRVPDLLHALRERDLLILSADHGNDPTTPSTDHSREYVSLLVYSPLVQRVIDLGTRSTFADLGQTLAEVFGVEKLSAGTSFLSDLINAH